MYSLCFPLISGGLREAFGMTGRDLEAGGLLKPVGGEEHVVGELAEFLARPRAQALLGHHGCGLLRA